MNWEYMVVDTGVGYTQELQLQLTALGSIGWEAVGYTCMVQLGPNDASVLLKRESPTLPPPTDTAAGWHPDPSRRHQQRHWDGQRWTEHVATDGASTTDWPNVR